MRHVITIHFDGGAGPTNPGNGYGSYETVCGTAPELNHRQIRQQFGVCTSNQAEYLSLIAALKWLFHKTDEMETQLNILSDSKLVVMQVKKSWKVKCLHIRELRDRVLELLSCYDRWSINWVPREQNVKRFGH